MLVVPTLVHCEWSLLTASTIRIRVQVTMLLFRDDVRVCRIR